MCPFFTNTVPVKAGDELIAEVAAVKKKDTVEGFTWKYESKAAQKRGASGVPKSAPATKKNASTVCDHLDVDTSAADI